MLSNPSLLYKKQALYVIDGHSVFDVNQPGVRLKRGKEIVLLYHSPGLTEPPTEEWQQLIKILGACKLTEDDVVCINTATVSGLSWSSISKALPVNLVIMFGDLTRYLSANIQVRKHFTYNLNGIQLVKTEPLSVLLKSQADKGNLWTCLRGIFKL